MKPTTALLGGALVLSSAAAPELSGQFWQAGRPGEDVASVALSVGAVAPTTAFPDGAKHATGVAVGGSASWWLLAQAGFRANVVYSHTEGQEGGQFSAVAAHDPDIWLYSAELVVRLQRLGGGLDWFPYVSGGPAGKSYRWAIDKPVVGNSTSGWAYGGGLEVRPRGAVPIGIALDFRNYRSLYKWHGMQQESPTMNDLVFIAGVSVIR